MSHRKTVARMQDFNKQPMGYDVQLTW